MIEIREYPPQDGEKHKEFIAALRQDLDSCKLVNRNGVNIFLAIHYDRNETTFQVFGYDPKNFVPMDDLAISVLRANLSQLIRDRYKGGIDGKGARVVLCFGRDPFLKEDKQDSPKRQEDEPTLNVLPVEPRFRLDQMILAPKTAEELEDVITLVTLQDKIYDDWGFGEVDPKPRAIVNFFGPSGTGKTMAAHALASKFGKKILCLNYADIESKFVGDAPKNLMAAFDIAREHDAVLFFDEADSFLGKRITNVSHSADQAVNSLRSQLLMLLEEHSGVVVFATNLIENYDSAFQSRILKHIQFDLPTPELRFSLIQRMMPPKLPRKDGDFTEDNIQKLVEMSDGFSGREIKNAVLNGIIRAAKQADHVAFDDFGLSFDQAREARIAKKEQPKTDKRKKLRNKIRKALGMGKKRGKKNYRTVKAL